MELQEKLKTLKSIWGLLTGSIILFPGFSYLMDIADIKSSVLTAYYVGFSTVISLLALLYILSFLKPDKNDLKIKKIVIFSGIMAFILFSGFIVIKKTFVYDKYDEVEIFDKNEIVTYSYDKSGMVGKSIMKKNASIANRINEEYLNKFEMISLLLFVLSILSFTISFSSMGIYHYYNDKKINSSKR